MTELDEDTAKRIQGWAWAIAGTFHCAGGAFDREDLASIGVVRALKMYPRWDPKKGGLNTYMSHCIRSAIYDYLRAYTKSRCKHDGYLDHKTARFGSMEEWLSEHLKHHSNGGLAMMEVMEVMKGPNEDGSEAFEARDFLEQWRQRLSRREYLLLILRYGKGMTMREVGCVLGMEESRVSQIESRLRKRFDLPPLHVVYSQGNSREKARKVMMGLR